MFEHFKEKTKKIWNRFRNWFIFSVLGVGVALAATGGFSEISLIGECFVEAEINDPQKGVVLAVTKGRVNCLDFDVYILSKWQAGEMPNVDIAKVSDEEMLVAKNKIARDYGLVMGREENLYLALKNQTNLSFAPAKNAKMNIKKHEEYIKK